MNGENRTTVNHAMRVALVYPPFGPAGLPNLGLGILSAAVQQRGYDCKTFYWNLEFLNKYLPELPMAEKLSIYRLLTSRGVYPFNEWAFAHLAYNDPSQLPESETIQLLKDTETHLIKRSAGHVDTNYFLNLKQRSSEIVTEMANELDGYDIVGINTTFYQNAPALALARRIKLDRPCVRIVLGGANCDGEMGPALLSLFDYIDEVFCGEVDHSFPEFVDAVAQGRTTNEILGVYTRDSEGNVTGCAAPANTELDKLPYPDFDDYVETRQRIGIDEVEPLCLALESSRGCWWGAKSHCTFCGLNGYGMEYRMKNQLRFRDEVSTIVKRYNSQYLFMTDNILSMSYYDEFMEWAQTSGLEVNYFYEIKSNVKRSHVERMMNAGISAVQPGIESFSTEILELMGKGVSGLQNIAFLRYASEYGVVAIYNLLAGFPGEEPDEYIQLAEKLPALFHLRPPSGLVPIEFHRFSPYHKTPELYGISLQPSSRYRHIYPFPTHDIAKIAYIFTTKETMDLSYLESMEDVVSQWRNTYDPELCTLSWRSYGNSIEIDDKRPGFVERRYHLSGWATQLFHLLDRPRSLKYLVRQALLSTSDNDTAFLGLLFDSEISTDENIVQIHTTRDLFLEQPDVFLAKMCEFGLVFQDRESYLALPVSNDRKVSTADWLSVGV